MVRSITRRRRLARRKNRSLKHVAKKRGGGYTYTIDMKSFIKKNIDDEDVEAGGVDMESTQKFMVYISDYKIYPIGTEYLCKYNNFTNYELYSKINSNNCDLLNSAVELYINQNQNIKYFTVLRDKYNHPIYYTMNNVIRSRSSNTGWFASANPTEPITIICEEVKKNNSSYNYNFYAAITAQEKQKINQLLMYISTTTIPEVEKNIRIVNYKILLNNKKKIDLQRQRKDFNDEKKILEKIKSQNEQTSATNSRPFSLLPFSLSI